MSAVAEAKSEARAERVATRVSTHEDAARFVSEVAGTMALLLGVVERETALLSAGRLREGLSEERAKSELAAAFMLGLERLKGNAVVLARFVPNELDALRADHDRFRIALERNQTVIATARAVSEGLLKSLANEMDRDREPVGYARPGALDPPSHKPRRPLAFSGRF